MGTIRRDIRICNRSIGKNKKQGERDINKVGNNENRRIRKNK